MRVAGGEQRLGVIDCLGIGFEKINAILWVLVFPLAMGLFLWRGPQLLARPAIAGALQWYADITPTGAEAGLLAADGADSLAQLREVLGSLGDLNLFTFLTLGLGVAGRGAIPAFELAGPQALFTLPEIARPAEVLIAIVGLQALGLLLGAAYLGFIAQCVRGEVVSAGRLLNRVWRYWLSIASFLAALLLVALVAGVAMAMVLGLFFVFAAEAAGTILMAVLAAWQVAALWMLLLTFFVVDAAVVAELTPLKALRSSVRVVRRFFWSSTAFILLYLLISYGMWMVWSWLDGEGWGTSLALVGHAYVGTGLAAASMVYYRARAKQLDQESRAGG